MGHWRSELPASWFVIPRQFPLRLGKIALMNRAKWLDEISQRFQDEADLVRDDLRWLIDRAAEERASLFGGCSSDRKLLVLQTYTVPSPESSDSKIIAEEKGTVKVATGEEAQRKLLTLQQDDGATIARLEYHLQRPEAELWIATESRHRSGIIPFLGDYDHFAESFSWEG